MKKILVMLLALAPFFAFAQTTTADKKTAEERAQKHTEKMATNFNLSADQKAQVAVINKKYADIIEEKRAEKSVEKGARRTEAQKLVEARDAELKAVLTSEQYAQYLDNRAAHKDKRQAKKAELKAKRKANKKP